MLKARSFAHVDERITTDRFPAPKEIRNEFRLFQLSHLVSSQSVFDEMAKKGYRPANLHELLSWREWNGEDCILSLGSVIDINGVSWVPLLAFVSEFSKPRVSGVYLANNTWWGSSNYFLGVPITNI